MTSRNKPSAEHLLGAHVTDLLGSCDSPVGGSCDSPVSSSPLSEKELAITKKSRSNPQCKEPHQLLWLGNSSVDFLTTNQIYQIDYFSNSWTTLVHIREGDYLDKIYIF